MAVVVKLPLLYSRDSIFRKKEEIEIDFVYQAFERALADGIEDIEAFVDAMEMLANVHDDGQTAIKISLYSI